MGSEPELEAMARRIIEGNRYMTIEHWVLIRADDPVWGAWD
jgi:hypothetical protein